jgi:hypothetical protein
MRWSSRTRDGGRRFPVQLSNSQGCFFRWSHARTANRRPLRLGMLRRPRCGKPREPRIPFSISLPKERLCFAPQKRGSASWLPKEGAERRRAHPGCLPFAKDRRRPCEAGSPYGAPLRRFQSLVPHLKGTLTLGLIMGREAALQGLPGPRCAKTAGAGAAPHPRSDRSRERPSVDRDDSDLYSR